MNVKPSPFKKFIFVCENKREEGACCSSNGEALREKLKSSLKSKGLASKIRVSRSGCLDLCAEGPNVLLMPDNKWFSGVREVDLDEIVREAQGGLV